MGDMSVGVGGVHRHRADEGGHPWVGRLLVDLRRRPDLHDAPRIHDGHSVAQHQRFLSIMSHEHRGHARGLKKLAHLGADVTAQRGVQVGKWFVQEQGRGLGG